MSEDETRSSNLQTHELLRMAHRLVQTSDALLRAAGEQDAPVDSAARTASMIAQAGACAQLAAAAGCLVVADQIDCLRTSMLEANDELSDRVKSLTEAVRRPCAGVPPGLPVTTADNASLPA